MKVLKATFEQMKDINNFQKGSDKIQFATDGEGQFVIGKQVLEDPAFISVKEILLTLEEIDYVPPVEEEE